LRSIGVLKAIGTERGQIQQMMITEGALIGLSATLLGVFWGLLFSAYVVKELLYFQIGWRLDWHLSGVVLLDLRSGADRRADRDLVADARRLEWTPWTRCNTSEHRPVGFAHSEARTQSPDMTQCRLSSVPRLEPVAASR
jgi:hypothetical protein